jgi:AcrR family transcriptional regulator
MSLPEWKSGSNFDAFHALDEEKQSRIINAALEEFAQKGYKLASTNEIAKTAQIGKGMLFYYFGSKNELFDFLCEYTIAFACDQYLTKFRVEEPDFLLRYQKLTEIKKSMMSQYPLHISFFESFYKEGNDKYYEKYLKDTSALREQVISAIFKDLDYSLFRDDIDPKLAITYIRWLFDAYQSEVADRFKRGEIHMDNKEEIPAEWTRFAEFTGNMRRLFYKEGK